MLSIFKYAKTQYEIRHTSISILNTEFYKFNSSLNYIDSKLLQTAIIITK